MEIYNSANKQIALIYRFFIKNIKVLVIGTFLVIIMLIGWHYWRVYHYSTLREVSEFYQQLLINTIESSNAQKLKVIEKFIDKNHNIYGALVSLNLVKHYVDKDELTKAVQQLQNGMKNTRDTNLQAIMNIRLARIKLQQKQVDDALKAIDLVKGKGWISIVANIRGEALLSKGDKLGAREAWSKGIASASSPELKEIMQMKINKLG